MHAERVRANMRIRASEGRCCNLLAIVDGADIPPAAAQVWLVGVDDGCHRSIVDARGIVRPAPDWLRKITPLFHSLIGERLASEE